ncbi:MAG: type II toxin-antitoxin system VapC family toxin [Alphaproteobacteria bacterium]|nr:type II toxin-antitoxin system VapC family toxin [Alphaproteobacteria bacterium]
MIYFDTSFPVPLFLEEATSKRIELLIGNLPAGEAATSHWTRSEFSSVLAREVRMGGLEADEAREVDSEFEKVLVDSFNVLLPERNDFDLAKQYLARHHNGLRAGDALHLAIATNCGARTIYSLDKTFLKAGAALALPVSGAPR